MWSEPRTSRDGPLQVDTWDGVQGSVYVNSSVYDDFQQWTDPTDDPPSPEQQAPPGSGTAARRSSDSEPPGHAAEAPRTSIVDCLLVELYETCGGSRRHVDSWDSSTEASGSDAFLGGSGFLQELQEKHTRRHQVNYLAQKGEGC